MTEIEHAHIAFNKRDVDIVRSGLRACGREHLRRNVQPDDVASGERQRNCQTAGAACKLQNRTTCMTRNLAVECLARTGSHDQVIERREIVNGGGHAHITRLRCVTHQK